MRLAHSILPLLSASVLSAACADDKPDPNDPSQFQGTYGYGAQYPGAPPTTTTTAPPPPAPAPMPQTSGGTATPIPPLLAGAAQVSLSGIAQTELRGMSPEAGPFAGTFQPEQTLEQDITIQPGKCYGVVGIGMGITELDVQIVLHQPPLPPYTAQQDNQTGAKAVIGSGGNCYRSLLPAPTTAKVILIARAGTGIGMAQVFSK
jgi:hypothetical protein